MTIVEHHDLVHEFPEKREIIHELKMRDPHFRNKFDQYHTLDRTVRRIEEGVEHASALEFEDMKKQRMILKDELYAMLSAAS